ncbi:MAG: VOC family protein [Acidimicrobiia bacterium]
MDVLSGRIILRAADLARSRRFYEQTLGLAVYREYGQGGITTGVVYFLGGGFLEITGGGHAPVPDGPIVWMQVRDVVAEQDRLVAAGVSVHRPAERMPWGLVECWLRDPDGWELRLVEVPEDHPIRRRLD